MDVVKRSPLKRYAELRRGKKLKQRSAKKERELRTRRSVRVVVLARDGGCRGRLLWPEVQCWGRAELDEMQSRKRGGDPTNPDHVQLLCTAHNQAKEDHPAEAHARGLARWSYESPIVPPPPNGPPPRYDTSSILRGHE